MSGRNSGTTAVLGPTNTGKTHLAVERLCAHSSGIMGFPLRLLAREIYDRVVAIKGEKSVGLLTGEERIVPKDARWLLSTVESMPLDRDVAFVAVDEIQLATDEERGHVFTDRLMRARGREETMLLGSEAMRPMVQSLVPEAEIITRPRFSRLSYAGPKKLSRLPPRSVIVAFSANEVYAIAEALRRTKGGAAVVMGSLSPQTRNAQVDLFQSGEVDYLVATDAIGMGLNLDIGHLAFASLTKFDGKRERRLTIPEMAQIAGRAGRHQRDGSFGVLLEGKCSFTDQEIERIEEHRFGAISSVYWRNPNLDFGSIDSLIKSLTLLPLDPGLKAAPEAVDLAVLKAYAGRSEAHAVRDEAAVRRLWDACGLPDFRKLGPEHHAQLVASIYQQIGPSNGVIDKEWMARELARLDSIQGDVDTLSARMAAVRTWAYVAHRKDWLAEPAPWAEKARALETRLSDALHQKLMERFIDRRTSVLVRALADHSALHVTIDEYNKVWVEDTLIGALSGFRFQADSQARLADQKRLLAAAENHLSHALAKRAQACIEAGNEQFDVVTNIGEPISIAWRRMALAQLGKGKDILSPAILLDAGIRSLPPVLRDQIMARLRRWMEQKIQRFAPPMRSFADQAARADASPNLRAILHILLQNFGLVDRTQIEGYLRVLSPPERKCLVRMGIIIGTLDVFHPLMLKPAAVRWAQILWAANSGQGMPPLPMAGLGLLDRPSAALALSAHRCGYRRFGGQMVRIDLVERMARAAHDTRGKERQFAPEKGLATSFGVGEATFAQIMRALGFYPLQGAQTGQWRWRGRNRAIQSPKPINPAFEKLASFGGNQS